MPDPFPVRMQKRFFSYRVQTEIVRERDRAACKRNTANLRAGKNLFLYISQYIKTLILSAFQY
jgi:hypothetical protein